jgi:hypothetical protein
MDRKLAFVLAFLALASIPASAAAPELSGEGQVPGSKIIVQSVKRDAGGTVTARFQLVNDSPQQIKTYGALGEYFGMDYVTLVDAANKKKYLVVRDADKKCVCSELKQDSKTGTKFNLWAMFPAPPPAVQKITLVVPGFEPVEAPITATP